MNPEQRVFSLRHGRRGGREMVFRRRTVRFLLLTVLILSLITLSGAHLHGQIADAASLAAVNEMTASVNRSLTGTVGEKHGLYNRLVTISRASDGSITAIETDTAAVSELSTAFTALLLADLPEGSEISFPAGNLIGSDFFNGRGAPISFRMVISGGIRTEVKSEFRSVGINQTLHRLYLAVETEVTVFLPGNNISESVNISLPLTETVIVGNVPDVFFSTGN